MTATLTAAAAIAALEDALRSGARVVSFSDGRSITYRSSEELQTAIAYFKRQCAAGSTGYSPKFSRGL